MKGSIEAVVDGKSGEIFLQYPFHRISSVCVYMWGCIELPPGETSCKQTSMSSSVESYYIVTISQKSEMYEIISYVTCATYIL